MLNVGWFSTGRDEAARQLLQVAHENMNAGEIEGKISFVFSNREHGESKESDAFFNLVHHYDIPLISLSHRKFKNHLASRNGITVHEAKQLPSSEEAGKQYREAWRLKYDSEVNKRIKGFSPDICMLAGYMLIVGEELCRKYNMVNLHPAPPGGPTGSWQEVIHELIRSKSARAGAMMHLVTSHLDRGPVVSYCTFSITGDPFNVHRQQDDEKTLFQLIRRHELIREFPLVISTLKAFSRGEIAIRDGRVIDGSGNYINGYDLSARIDQVVETGERVPWEE